MKYLKEFETNAQYEAYIEGTPSLPNVSLIDEDESVKYKRYVDYSKKYLTFVALEDGTFTFTNVGSGDNIQYSIDNGRTWTSLASGVASPTVQSGKKIMWKGTRTPNGSVSTGGIGRFNSSGRYNIEGNIMSLLFGDNFQNQTSLSGKNAAFVKLFDSNSKLISAENVIMPATTLSNYCYNNTFSVCDNLIKAPLILPATTLAQDCYQRMFYNCSSLITAPQLPATTLEFECYDGMFQGCSALTSAPELPATILTGATNRSCYGRMFYNCTSLTEAPELPSTTLGWECYSNMFNGCSSLNYIKMVATDVSQYNCLTDWVKGVANEGTFVKNSAMTTLPTGNSGIPSGWEVINA